MTAEDKYLNEHFTVSDIKFSREEMVIIMRKYTKLQCQKQDELIKAQDEVIKILQEQSTYNGEYSLTDLINKIKQLKNEIQ